MFGWQLYLRSQLATCNLQLAIHESNRSLGLLNISIRRSKATRLQQSSYCIPVTNEKRETKDEKRELTMPQKHIENTGLS